MFEEAFVKAEIIAVQCLHFALKFPLTPWGMPMCTEASFNCTLFPMQCKLQRLN